MSTPSSSSLKKQKRSKGEDNLSVIRACLSPQPLGPLHQLRSHQRDIRTSPLAPFAGHPPGCAPRSPLPEIQPPLLPTEAAGSGADLASYTYQIILSWINLESLFKALWARAAYASLAQPVAWWQSYVICHQAQGLLCST